MDIKRFIRRAALATVASAPIFFQSSPAGAQAQVQIAIDGNAVSVNPAPVIQGGRVFVPLRGVFERLGASVVYDAGEIDATSNSGEAISMHLGSTQATVNGAAQAIDVAPFLVGESTFVPLRFISQALGANVSWDGSQQLVSIATNAQASYATPQPSLPSYAYDDASMSEPPPPLPEYDQPPVPQPDYIWQPGYWASSSNTGYFWVPGTWVPAPQTNLLWTPPYWGFNDGSFGFHPGYWSQVVGYYGGVNYGNGYSGDGYTGGRWENNVYNYNTAVTNVTNVTVIKNVYVEKINTSPVRVRTSYNGGPHGIQGTPTPAQMQSSRVAHVPMTPIQREHLVIAAQDRRNFASVNGGTPPTGAVAKPYTATEKPADAETPAAQDKIEAQKTLANPLPPQRAEKHFVPAGPPELATPLHFEEPKPAIAKPPAHLVTTPQPIRTPLPYRLRTSTPRPKLEHPTAHEGVPKTPPPLTEPLRPKTFHQSAPMPGSTFVLKPRPKETIEPK